MNTEKEVVPIQSGDLFSGNPEELPSDPADVAAMIEKQAGGEPAKKDEAPATPAQGAASTLKPDEGKPAAKPDEQQQVIATKDGKHVLPYSELQQARTKAREATERANVEAKARAEAEAKAAALDVQIKDLQEKHKDAGTKGEAEVQSEAEFTELVESLEKENLHAVAKVLKSTREQGNTRIAALEVTLKELKSQQEQLLGTVSTVAKREQQSVQEMVDEAIDGNAKLRFLRDKNPELYDEAVSVDEGLRASPAFSKMADSAESFGKRFNAVIAALEAAHGAIELPPEYLTVDDVTKLAAEKVKAAGDFKPGTLSDLPGGVIPGTKPATEGMSAADLHVAMQGMTEEQIAEVLARAA